MDFGTRLIIWWRAQLVGEDEFGNRYYEDRKPDHLGHKKRWVKYKGIPEASKIPADWHSWMHYVQDDLPKVHKKYYWEKPHQPNRTGTPQSYHPKDKSNQGVIDSIWRP